MMIQGAMMAKYKAEKVAWKNLEPNIQEAASRFGIGEKEWSTIMKADLTTHPDMEGVSWLMPENVTQIDVEAGRKYGDWMTTLGTFAVNEPRLLTRAITTGAAIGDARQGSLLRLMAANVFFAKSFPITIVLNHLLPAMRAASNGRVGHLAAVGAGSAVMGALAIQLRQIVQGKTTQDMDNGTFWIRAFMQGGGAGLFGDFFLADYNRAGQSPLATALGPIAGTAQSLLKAGDLYGLAEGEWDASTAFTDVLNIAEREIPGVNLWYSRLFVERALLDQVENLVDPKYDSRMLRLEKQMMKKNGQKYWWRPGELQPNVAQ
jgi:hypothetical protein